MVFFTLIFLPEFWGFVHEYINVMTAVIIDLIIVQIFKYITMDKNLIK